MELIENRMVVWECFHFIVKSKHCDLNHPESGIIYTCSLIFKMELLKRLLIGLLRGLKIYRRYTFLANMKGP
jgi:hypothetical protein